MIETLILYTVLVNSLRTPLVPSLLLSNLAQQRAEELCNRPFSHQNFQQVFIKNKLLAKKHGEILAKGFASPRETFTAWKNSPKHLAVMQESRWEEVGYGEACGVTVLLFD